jgi:hypothetical protein
MELSAYPRDYMNLSLGPLGPPVRRHGVPRQAADRRRGSQVRIVVEESWPQVQAANLATRPCHIGHNPLHVPATGAIRGMTELPGSEPSFPLIFHMSKFILCAALGALSIGTKAMQRIPALKAKQEHVCLH